MDTLTFRSMLAEMGVELGLVPDARSDEPTLRCSFCDKPLRKGGLFSIVLDVCERDGIWFDNAELQKTLAGSAGLDVDPETPLENSVSLLQQVLAPKNS